jgi:hypothetical protein
MEVNNWILFGETILGIIGAWTLGKKLSDDGYDDLENGICWACQP